MASLGKLVGLCNMGHTYRYLIIYIYKQQRRCIKNKEIFGHLAWDLFCNQVSFDACYNHVGYIRSVCIRYVNLLLLALKHFITVVRHYCVHVKYSQRKEATIPQVTTMLSTYRIVLFPGHNPLLTTGADDLTL